MHGLSPKFQLVSSPQNLRPVYTIGVFAGVRFEYSSIPYHKLALYQHTTKVNKASPFLPALCIQVEARVFPGWCPKDAAFSSTIRTIGIEICNPVPDTVFMIDMCALLQFPRVLALVIETF